MQIFAQRYVSFLNYKELSAEDFLLSDYLHHKTFFHTFVESK